MSKLEASLYDLNGLRRWLPVVAAAFVTLLLQGPAARAQSSPPCPNVPLMSNQYLVRIPEFVSKDGKLRGTILLGDDQRWMAFRVPRSKPAANSTNECFPQYVRVFTGVGATPELKEDAPQGVRLPLPGPTLRARVGDLVQLTFVNQINASDFPYSMDRGELGAGPGGGCDESSAGYPLYTNPNKPNAPPVGDRYPDCFHGSSTGNIHFHGTHTNMNTTGDNVFIEVRPSLRVNNKPIVTPQSVEKSFNEFFSQCEAELSFNQLRQWPMSWNDLPSAWTDEQKWLLKLYDNQMQQKYGSQVRKLWPVDEKQLLQGAWPQYYIGAFPYCFRLPRYTATTFPPTADHAAHGGAGTAEDPDITRPLMMGQAPGTHWYHAHKHGSTAINVANGMTGAFIIEGDYDDKLNDYYGTDWTRTQPLMVINQLGVTPNLARGAAGQIDKGPDFSVNGRLQPKVKMAPGEVQMWRIVNTSGRAAAYFAALPQGFEWRQIAQDGVQFSPPNYQASEKATRQPFAIVPGGRVDLLVKAPKTCATPCAVKVQNIVAKSDLSSAYPMTLMTVELTGSLPPNSNRGNFIPQDKYPLMPVFLKDIKGSDVKGTKTVEFGSTPPPATTFPPDPPAQHTINGKKFDGEVGEVVLLNTVEEWKVINNTFAAPISHPFHIHINPFQVTEIFAPGDPVIDPTTSEPMQGSNGSPLPQYVFDKSALDTDPNKAKLQCLLDPNNPDTWKPCGQPKSQSDLIWWDTFPIPTGVTVTTTDKKTVLVPGYFKMRSRFVDYAGYYVMHCHILAHEDRGMMTVVEVAPARSPYSHH
ncbi:MAG TPA: multicopper oxidase domain-containing protein [Blastocatellia bacterium]|nr:multicopper oxidase domain-containing protein [Blastocatellia bacterium]